MEEEECFVEDWLGKRASRGSHHPMLGPPNLRLKNRCKPKSFHTSNRRKKDEFCFRAQFVVERAFRPKVCVGQMSKSDGSLKSLVQDETAPGFVWRKTRPGELKKCI